MPKDAAASAVGRTQTQTGGVGPAQASMLGATLVPDWDPGSLPEGAVLPPLWHWAAFPPAAPMEDLGSDGHERLGRFLPDLGLERRMWAGGALRFHAPVHVGEALTRRSEIISIEHKEAGTGPMEVVKVRHAIAGAEGLAIEEEQTLVYLEIPDAFRPPKRVPVPAAPAFDRTLPMSATLLFRYSAATFNGHRIHYDRAYATDVEHYPGLVVHGPLQATLLIAAATEHRGAPPVSFRFRGIHPMFDTHDLRVIGVETDEGGLDLCTAAPEGFKGLQASAEWV